MYHPHHNLNVLRAYWPLGCLLLGIDQATKYAIVYHQTLLPYALNDYLTLSFVENHGVIWGMSQGYGTFMSLLGMLLLVGYILVGLDNPSQPLWSWMLMLTGGVGNTCDRLFHGSVIDWIDIHIEHYHWPSFNCADIYLVASITCMLLCWLYPKAFPHKPL